MSYHTCSFKTLVALYSDTILGPLFAVLYGDVCVREREGGGEGGREGLIHINTFLWVHL
jgi:hypothetical protein